MNPEVLERLLMDRALGALAPDVEELLSEHLAAHPAASQEEAELDEVVKLAARAVSHPLPAMEPPQPVLGLFWRHRARQALALAAAFVIGAGFTAWMLHPTAAREASSFARGPEPRPVPAATAARPAAVDRVARTLPFWSNERVSLLVAAASQAHREPTSP